MQLVTELYLQWLHLKLGGSKQQGTTRLIPGPGARQHFFINNLDGEVQGMPQISTELGGIANTLENRRQIKKILIV